MSIENNIFTSIMRKKRGTLFFAESFLDYGSAKTCNKSLERLTSQDLIVRIARGIYTLPKESKLLGVITPSLETIAKAIARRDKARIIPTGGYAMNILGLSTQVPMKVIYLTDGLPRKICIGNSVLVFKKTAPKNLALKGEISGLVVQALKTIGNERVTKEEEEIIIRALRKEDQNNIINDIKLAPEWIRVIMRRAL